MCVCVSLCIFFICSILLCVSHSFIHCYKIRDKSTWRALDNSNYYPIAIRPFLKRLKWIYLIWCFILDSIGFSIGLKSLTLPQKVLKKLNPCWRDGWKRPKKGIIIIIIIILFIRCCMSLVCVFTILFCSVEESQDDVGFI